MRSRFLNPDKLLLIALGALLVSVISQPLGMLIQFFIVWWIAWHPDIRYVPSLYISLLTKGNFSLFWGHTMMLRMGVTLTSDSAFLLMAFLVVWWGIVKQRYDGKTKMLFWFWQLAAIPAFIMSFTARANGLIGIWSMPMMDYFAPTFYFWGWLAARTWDQGKTYFAERMIVILGILNILWFVGGFRMFTFFLHSMSICLFLAASSLGVRKSLRMVAGVGALAGVGCVLFSRYMSMAETSGAGNKAELGSTFTNVAIVVFVVSLSWIVGKIGKGAVLRLIPYVALAFCSIIFFYAVANPKQLSAVQGDFRYTTLKERFEWKLFGDRGSVWSMGLEEVFDKPYFIKDLRIFLVETFDPETGRGKMGMKLLPHNQVCYLLGRDGWWLGGILLLFLWLMHCRTFAVASRIRGADAIKSFLVPVAAAQFIAVGLTGQTVLTPGFAGHALATLFFPGLIWGVYQTRLRARRQMYGQARG